MGAKAGRRTIACVVGTRPEAIKMAPVVARLRVSGAGLDVRLVATGQHRGLLDRALADFGLTADVDLDAMRPGQGLAELTARLLVELGGCFRQLRPDLVLAQGDTTTVLAAALAGTYERVPFGHVEAGLRTGRADAPFPEETNRVLVARLAALHFAPTETARANLLAEGIDPAAIHVTGNPVIDALRRVARHAPPLPVAPATRRFMLVTAHRRESFGAPLRRIAAAVADLVRRNPDLSAVIPVHPNPRARHVLRDILGSCERVHLIEPVGYAEFVALMRSARVVLTDSGGVQEEAPALGTPVVVLREVTERPEAIAAGAARLVGTHRGAIVAAVEALWRATRPPSRGAVLPFGDGHAAERIARIVAGFLGLDPDGFAPGDSLIEGRPLPEPIPVGQP